MININVPIGIDATSKEFDDIHFKIKTLLVDSRNNIINIPDFIIEAKQKLRLNVDIIKIGIIIVAKREPNIFYLERISEYYTDQRRHYILYDGFIRNRILIRCPS